MGRKGKKPSRKLLKQRRLMQRLTLSRKPVVTIKPRGTGSNVFSLISKITRTSSATGRSLVQGRYTHRHRILLIGEGNFSFAVALASSLGGDRIVATSFDSSSELSDKYPEARENVVALNNMGVRVLHGIDATKLEDPRLGTEVASGFDRVVFNFPHVGGGSVKEDLAANQRMLSQFLARAGQVLSATGEIHITLRSSSFYDAWEIDSLAEHAGLESLGAVPFDQQAFHGYQQVRTRGSTCMREAPGTAGAKTHRFVRTGAATIARKQRSKQQQQLQQLASKGAASNHGGGARTTSSSSSSEESDDDSHVDRATAAADKNTTATKKVHFAPQLTTAIESKRKLLLELKTERQESDEERKDSDEDLDLGAANLRTAQNRKRRLLLELRRERDTCSDEQTAGSKRGRTHTVTRSTKRKRSEIDQSAPPKEQHSDPEDPVAAMLRQWKQATAYT